MAASERRDLDRADAKLKRAEEALEDARQEWATVVRSIGITTSAEYLGMSRQNVSERVRASERKRK
jgi:hypothetical protein